MNGQIRKSGGETRVVYLNHSSFYFEQGQNVYLFDYGTVPRRPSGGELSSGIFAGAQFDWRKPIIGYSSHRHADHYDSKLIRTFLNHGKSYWLSDEADLPLQDFMQDPLFVRMLPRQIRQLSERTVYNSGSTDQGGAILVENDQLSLFFAGDLAVWDDETIFYDGFEQEFNWFKQVRSNERRVDWMFLPCGTSDGWQERPLLEGNRRLIEWFRPRWVVPMHGSGYEVFYPAFGEYMVEHVCGLRVASAAMTDVSRRMTEADTWIAYPQKPGDTLKLTHTAD